MKFYLIDKLKPKKEVNKLFGKMVESSSDLYLLGQNRYNNSVSIISSSQAVNQIDRFFRSMKKFTYNEQIRYRKEFISDVGWGCTIRSGQMVLFNMLLFKIIQARLDPAQSRNLEDRSINLLNLFHDNKTTNFSFGNFIEKSSEGAGKKLNDYWNAKEFFMACEGILKENNNLIRFLNVDIRLKVIIADDGAINVGAAKEALSRDMAVLLVFNINIGCEENRRRFKKEFFDLIELQFFSGMIVGKRKEAYYVFGSYADKLLYLDPHKIRDWTSERNFDVSTYYEISYDKLNASITLTFTVLDTDEFYEFLDEVNNIKTDLLYEQTQDVGETMSECEVSELSFNQDLSFEKVADTNDFHNVNGVLLTSAEIERQVITEDKPSYSAPSDFYKIPFSEEQTKSTRKDSGPFAKQKPLRGRNSDFSRKDSFIELNGQVEELRREMAQDFLSPHNYMNF